MNISKTAKADEKPEERKGLQQRDNNTLYLPPLFNDTLNLNLSLSHNTSTLRSFMRVLNLDQNALLNQVKELFQKNISPDIFIHKLIRKKHLKKVYIYCVI